MSATTSSAHVLDSSRRQIVNRITIEAAKTDLSNIPAAAALFFRPSYFVILHCQIRLDVFLPQVGLCEGVSPGGERVTLSRRWVCPASFVAQETSP